MAEGSISAQRSAFGELRDQLENATRVAGGKENQPARGGRGKENPAATLRGSRSLQKGAGGIPSLGDGLRSRGLKARPHGGDSNRGGGSRASLNAAVRKEWRAARQGMQPQPQSQPQKKRQPHSHIEVYDENLGAEEVREEKVREEKVREEKVREEKVREEKEAEAEAEFLEAEALAGAEAAAAAAVAPDPDPAPAPAPAPAAAAVSPAKTKASAFAFTLAPSALDTTPLKFKGRRPEQRNPHNPEVLLERNASLEARLDSALNGANRADAVLGRAERAEARLEMSEGEALALERELAEAEARHARELAEAEADLERAREQREGHREEARSNAAAIGGLRRREAALLAEVAAGVHERQILMDSLDDAHRTVRELEGRVASQESQMQEHCERITGSAREMQRVLLDAAERQEELERALEESEAARGDLSQRCQEASRAAAQLGTRTSGHDERLALLAKVGADAEQVNAGLREEIAQREGELLASRQRIEELEELGRGGGGEAEEKIADLTRRLQIATVRRATDGDDTLALRSDLEGARLALQDAEREGEGLLRAASLAAKERDAAVADYGALEGTVAMYRTTLENAEAVSADRVRSLEEQLLDAERTHADAEQELGQALEARAELERVLDERKAARDAEVERLRGEISKALGDLEAAQARQREAEAAAAKSAANATTAEIPAEVPKDADSSIDGDLVARNEALSLELRKKDEEVEKLKVCMEYLKDRVAKANRCSDELRSDMRDILARNTEIEGSLTGNLRNAAPRAVTTGTWEDAAGAAPARRASSPIQWEEDPDPRC